MFGGSCSKKCEEAVNLRRASVLNYLQKYTAFLITHSIFSEKPAKKC